MTQFVFTNNASTTLTSAVGPTTTTFQVASGAAFPTPSAGQQFTLWLTDAATGQVHEVVYATANASNQFTVVRGQEGTAAASWAIGDIVQHNCTAGPLNTYADAYTVQAQAGNYATDTGAANALAIALTPTPGALSTLVGSPIRIKVANTNTGATTLNVNGLGAVTVQNPDATALYPNQIAAGSIIGVVYNGTVFTITSGSAVIEGTSALLTTIDANNGGQLRLTNGNYGFLLRNDGASVYLMQTASGSPLGTFNALRPFAWALTTGQVTLDGTGAGVTTGGPLAIGTGAFGSGNTKRVTTLGDFSLSPGLDGYQYLPNGFLVQWGQFGIGAGTTPTTYNFAYAFPNACFGMVIGYQGDVPPTTGAVGATATSKTQFIATNTNTAGGSNGVFYIAVGN